MKVLFFVNELFCKKMVLFASSFWFSITSSLYYLFTFITGYLFRFHVDDSSQKNNPNCPNVNPHEQKEIEPEVIDFGVTEYDGFGEKETPRFSFKFQFQPNEEETQNAEPTINTNKCQFMPGKDFRRFVEEPEVVSFTVEELYADWTEDALDSKEILGSGFLSEKDFVQSNLEPEPLQEEIVSQFGQSEDFDRQESVVLTQVQEQFVREEEILAEEEFSGFDSDPELVQFGDRFSVLVDTMDSNSEKDFLSEKDFDGEVGPETTTTADEPTEEIENSENNLANSRLLVQEAEDQSSSVQNPDDILQCSTIQDLEDKGMKLGDKIGSFEESYEQNSSNLETEVVTEGGKISNKVEGKLEDFDGEEEETQNPENNWANSILLVQEAEDQSSTSTVQNLEDKEMKLEDQSYEQNSSNNLETEVATEREKICSNVERKFEDFGKQKFEEPVSQNSSSEDSDDSSRLEVLWEHQDLIEQLKIELKKVRATGLPTILEESESPRMSDDLKPWNFDEKFLHEDRMDELHKFYKSYRERMRKFDILNYQKMYAIGFLQQKDPLQSFSMQKSSAPTIASILTQHLRLPQRRRPEADSVKFVKELQSALEMVYVGQMCLSWEFLHWQYGKAKELLESDPYETHQYNQVAGEFQQFQVLMQRFLENEPFQGPRVQHYIKNRCVLRNLLQVPVIKEDPKDKLGVRRRKDAITCSMLLVIIKESMRIFWDFLRSDRDEGNEIWKGLLSPHVELQDPADSEHLLEAQTILQKKEKKLKDILRSGNCIVKRFQKCHKERSDQLVFFSQVDLKLVSRVLNMTRLTADQLVWCHKKLNKINFVHRKIHVEPSFLPFPC